MLLYNNCQQYNQQLGLRFGGRTTYVAEVLLKGCEGIVGLEGTSRMNIIIR